MNKLTFLGVIMSFSQVDAVFAYLYGAGQQYRAYSTMGAHSIRRLHSQGVYFAVWAPHAKSVDLVGDFNGWRLGRNAMNPLGNTGIWELFVPGLETDAFYQYAIVGQDNVLRLKHDLYALAEHPLCRLGSRVCELSGFTWHDKGYMQKRSQVQKPVFIYEMTAEDFAALMQEASLDVFLDELSSYTYVKPNFPETVSFYAKGDPQKLMAFVDACHGHGLGVLMDWTPGQFSAFSHGFDHYDGTELFGSKGRFDFAHSHVRSYLLSNALFWAEQYHIDGFCFKDLASMIGQNESAALEWIREVNTMLSCEYPGFVCLVKDSFTYPKLTRPLEEGGFGFTEKA